MVRVLRSDALIREEREKDYFKYLPLEIILGILTRLPPESILNSKLVCTNWRSVVGHPSFYKVHIHHHLNHPSAESGELRFLAWSFSLTHYRLYYFEYNQNYDESTTPIQKITRVNLRSPFQHFSFRFAGSVNGLICLQSVYSRQSVCICNPITREYLILPEIMCTDEYYHQDTTFGYVSSTNEYKLVGFCKSKTETHLEVHIYTLGSRNGWRNLGQFSCGFSLNLIQEVFFANGALYWVDEEMKMIGTFNLAEEKFGEHVSAPPLPPNADWYDCSIGVLDGFLFFALEDEEDGFSDIWLLKKKNDSHGKEEGDEHQSFGWRREFRIDQDYLIAGTKSGGVLTISDNSYINIYDTKTSTSKSLVKCRSCLRLASPHKNTLISLRELGEEDVKVMESADIKEADADPEYIYL